MKILMGNNTLEMLGGTETWTLTMTKMFKQLGHEVTAYSTRLGFISGEMNKIGVSVRPELNPSQTFDIAILNHYEITKKVRETYPDLPIIQTIHGIRHIEMWTQDILPEMPYRGNNIKYATVSEESQKLLKNAYCLDSVVMRNPIDLVKFNLTKNFRPTPKTILFNTNYSSENSLETQVLKEVCRRNNMDLILTGLSSWVAEDMTDAINTADIVCGLGRSLLEGVAMGRLGFCHGHYGTGGVMTPETALQLRETSFSGRSAKGITHTAEQFEQDIKKYYTPENLKAMREYIEQEHDALKIANQYLTL
jgi:hypothetical protein